MATDSRGRGCIILAHNRQAFLTRAIEAVRPQVDTVMVLDNASEPPLAVPDGVGTMYIEEQPPNLAKFWNFGLEFFCSWFKGRPHDVAVICDDAIVPAGWFAAVTSAMRETGATVGCSDPFGYAHPPRLKTEPDRAIMERMPGWAWIVDGNQGLRADERLRWWYLDTKLDWDARRMNGMVMIGGYAVSNEQPGHYTNVKPELGEQAGRDREAFTEIEGWRPW